MVKEDVKIDRYQHIGGHQDFSSPKAQIETAIKMRVESDNIMSPLWCLAPLVGGVVLIAGIVFALGVSFMLDMTPLFSSEIAAIFIVIALVVYVILIAYPLYLMIKRRTEHFKRDHLLMSGIIGYLTQKSSEKEVSISQEIATLNSIMSEANFREDEKTPLMYTIIALIIPIIGLFYVLYFLMDDVYSHHKRIEAFMKNSQDGLNKVGGVVIVPSWKTLPQRNFATYFSLSIVFPPFAIYWVYGLIKDYNQHFKDQWLFEDQILTHEKRSRPYSRYPSIGQLPYYKETHYGQPTRGPYQQPPQGNPCPDCGNNMQYINEYNRWYCKMCRQYK
ncbi:MAG: hypothetical protein R6U17_09630 [Thermoplasmata archaeon]